MVTILATTSILLLIFMSTQFVHYLSGAAVGKYTAEILLQVMALQVPYLLGLLIPAGLYVALLMAYGRLHTDREMMVLASCGMSQAKLIGITMGMAGVVMVVVAILNLWLSPIVTTSQRQLFAKAKSAPLVETILPGRFFSSNNGKTVFYVESISRDHSRMQNIFFAQKLKPGTTGNAQTGASVKANGWSVVSATSGEEQQHKDGKYVIINNGYRYQGQAGQRNFDVAQFKHYGFRITDDDHAIPQKPQMMSTKKLWQIGSSDPKVAAELQWRLSMPLSVLILALLAVPLSYVNPRQGRFAQLIPAVMIYILYANMMFLDRSWIQVGKIPVALGVWWLHGIVLALALILLAWRAKWFSLAKRKWLSKRSEAK